MENYLVYKITNLINGKLYIGQTIRTIEERFNDHIYDDSNIGNAIREYGCENFSIEVIEKCKSKEELNAYENYYIAYFDSKEPNGYNLIGGDIEAVDKFFDRAFGEQRWFALFQDYALKIAHSDLTGEQCKVLFYLFNKLDFDNYIPVKQKDIVDELKINKQQVSRSVKALKDNDIIYEATDYKGFYKLNPHVGHKGTQNYGNNVVEFEKIRYEKEQKTQQGE